MSVKALLIVTESDNLNPYLRQLKVEIQLAAKNCGLIDDLINS